jgi:3'-phosphoadenosine 5'-phosphosulfate sulfotransferase (PAPS reductase)/FAD synthetase
MAALPKSPAMLHPEPMAAEHLERVSETVATPRPLTHLQRLEAESIHILREVVAEADRPVML